MSAVQYEVSGALARVRLNRPDKNNALSEEMVAELARILSDADNNPNVGAIVLSAEGKNFCAGGDLEDFLAARDQPLEQGYHDITPSMALFALGFQLRTPVIASVQGAVRGGGVGLVALAHLAVAEPSATFALPEVQLGLFPFGIFPLLSRVMGPRRSLELALLGRTIDAEEARTYGLVHQISGDCLQDAEDMGQMLASRSPLAVATGLQAYNHLTDPGAWPFGYLGLLRQLTFKSDALGRNVEKFLARHKSGPET